MEQYEIDKLTNEILFRCNNVIDKLRQDTKTGNKVVKIETLCEMVAICGEIKHVHEETKCPILQQMVQEMLTICQNVLGNTKNSACIEFKEDYGVLVHKLERIKKMNDVVEGDEWKSQE